MACSWASCAWSHPQLQSSHELVLLSLCPQKEPELIPWFHSPLLPLSAWQGSPTCSHQQEKPSRQAEPHETPLRPCKSKSQIRLLLPSSAHKPPPGDLLEGKGRAQSVGHELLSSREWCQPGFISQFQAAWAAGTGSQMSESKGQRDTLGFVDKGNVGSSQGPGEQQGDPQGMFLATKAGEMGRTQVQSSPTECPSTAGCFTRAAPPRPGQLVVPRFSLELPGIQTGGLSWDPVIPSCWAGSGSQSCVTRWAEGGQAGIPSPHGARAEVTALG